MEYQISNDQVTVHISSLGAEMQDICANGTSYLWNGDATYWSDRSPLLFPFIGRLTNGQYRFHGTEYKMDIHGFAYRMDFSAEKQSENSITLSITDTPETFAIYPFHFVLKVIYRLEGNQIHIRYVVINSSFETMYFGIGGHPGFRVPLEEGLTFEDYCLEFASSTVPGIVGHTKTCFLSGEDIDFPLQNGKVLPLKHSMFNDDAIVLKNMANRVTLNSDKGQRQVTVSYPNLPYLGLWHVPQTKAPYICIEPWTSLPSREGIIEDFEYKSDLIRLAVGAEYENEWTIALR